MSAPTDLLGWVTRAEEDFTLARSALRRKKPLLYGATFHAPVAQRDLRALQAYMVQENIQAARRVLAEIRAACARSVPQYQTCAQNQFARPKGVTLGGDML